MSILAVKEILNAESQAQNIKQTALLKNKNKLMGTTAAGEQIIKAAEKTATGKSVEIEKDAENEILHINTASDSEIAKKVQALRKFSASKIPDAVKFISETVDIIVALSANIV